MKWENVLEPLSSGSNLFFSSLPLTQSPTTWTRSFWPTARFSPLGLLDVWAKTHWSEWVWAVEARSSSQASGGELYCFRYALCTSSQLRSSASVNLCASLERRGWSTR